ncbi:DUF5819 family protein [Streptomyces sp. 21So2-11]|uniref:DUF5819 family protein n=1 Tax=Streptomyces sp. 21So2-11 TaxID=3144408 RepID=UPI00321BFD57
MPDSSEATDVREREPADAEPATSERYGKSPEPGSPPGLAGPLKAGVGVAVALCLTVTLVHTLLVFLHVAPPNTISQQYSRQINAWVYPLFEQNWRLFAPDPESVNQQISARTMHTGPDGAARVSGWVDLTAVDHSAVEHNVFPSHTSQNMLRRAWTSYSESHGGDDRSRSERAVMMQQHLRNIAADRVAAHQGTFESIQLRVITLPIGAPGTAERSRVAPTAPAPADARYLPWWKVTSHGN